MADTRISALTELTAPAVLDELAIVDKSDTSMASSGTTKRLLASRVGQAAGIYNAVSYGADSSGSADSRSAIQDAIDACTAAGGGIVYLSPGTFKIGTTPGLQLKEGVKLQGAGQDATILSGAFSMTPTTAADDPAVITATGFSIPTSISTNVAATLNANVAPGDTTLTLVSTSGLVADTWYMLGSNDLQFASASGNRRGEFVRVKSVDSGTVVTLWGAARDTYTTANTAKLFTVTFVNGVGVSDLQVKNPSFGSTLLRFINLVGCRDFYVERVLMVDGDHSGVRTCFCENGRVDVSARNFNDDNAAGRNGYVVTIDGLNENIEVNVNVRRARHAVTSGTIGSTPGLNRGIKISGVATEVTAVAFDQHAGGMGWVFEDCHAYNCPGWGFQIRSLATKLIGCSTDYCDLGLNLVGTGSLGIAENTDVIGCIFRRSLNRSGSAGFAVNLDSTGTKRSRFIGCVFDGSARQMFVVNGGDVRVVGCEFYNPGQASGTRCIEVAAAGVVYVEGCTFVASTTATEDPLSSTNSPGVPAIRLQASSTGCYIGSGNKQAGFTAICQDLGTANTVEELSSAYTVTNPTTDRALNVTGDTLAQGLACLGTLITDLKTKGVIP